MIGSHAEFHAAAETRDDARETPPVPTIARVILEELHP